MGWVLVEVTFGILGRTALRIGGVLREDWAAPRVQAVFATLLVHAGYVVSVNTLLEWAWPQEKPVPKDPVSTFHTYATRIRRSLQRVSYPSTLHAGNGGYRLEVDKSLIDLHQFRDLSARARGCARQRDPESAVEYAEQSLELWRGRPVDGLSSEPAQAWRHRVMRDEWLPANTTLIEALVAIEEFDYALARLNDLQPDHSLDVNLVKLRLSALHGLSRSAEATTYYFSLRRRLLEEGDEQAADHVRAHYENLRVQPRPAGPVRLGDTGNPPRQLPHDIVDFVGRTDLLRALDAASTRPLGEPSSGVVILDGTAGVGKTALAVHWGHLARHRFPDGDFFVNLNGFSDGGQVNQSTVVDDLLIALGHAPDGGQTRRSRELLLSRLLASRRTLVVLDNARDTDHIKDLITLLAGCLVIVTSRQRLTTLSATTGARRVRVEPMPPAEAAELLSIRLGSGRHVDPDDRVRLVGLCGGLPLVITVLAEHVATSGAARLSSFAQQLNRRQLITDIGEDGDGSAIAKTFFTWSYRSLAPPDQRLFRLLGLHPGPDINVDLACAWDGRTPTETKHSIGALVGAHLLERPESFDRYQFHDLIKEFAAYCADLDEPATDRGAAERRMASHYLSAATQAHRTLYPGRLTAPDLALETGVEPVAFTTQSQARFWFDLERTNLTAAIHYTFAHGHHDLTWRLADTVASLLDRYSDHEESRIVRELAVASAAAMSDREAEASCQVGLGSVLMTLGDHQQARICLEAGLRFAEDTGNERGQASTLYQLGRLEMARGDPATAVDLFQRSLELARAHDDHEGLCWTHCRLGQALRILKEYDQALMHLHQTQYHAQRIADYSAHAASLAEIGAIHRDLGDNNAATAYCEQALLAVETAPYLDIIAQICTTLAEIHIESGNAKTAHSYAERALEVSQRTHNASAEAQARDVLGDASAAANELAAAIRAWNQAADIYDRIGNPKQSAAIRVKMDSIDRRGRGMSTIGCHPSECCVGHKCACEV